MIGHGGLDYILLRNGTLLTIQNMTWNGRQGFQSPIEDNFYVPYHTKFQAATMASAGIVGKTHTERGLTFFGVDQSGHMSKSSFVLAVSDPQRIGSDTCLEPSQRLTTSQPVPQYAPAAAYRSLELLLGRITSLTSREPFTPTSDGLKGQPQASEYGVSM